MNLLPWRKKAEERTSFPLSMQQYVDLFNYGNVFYPLGGIRQTLVGNTEPISGDYGGLISGAYQANGIVFACMLVRLLHFTEARFQFQQLRGGRPGTLFGTTDLDILETPWPNGTTSDLLARMIQDVDLAGNSYTLRQSGRLMRLRPDWVGIMLGSRTRREDWIAGDPDTELAGYSYTPGGPASGKDPIFYLPEQVAHFAPIPDPAGFFRGSSWVASIVREVMADNAMTNHKQKFLDQGATVNLLIKVPAETTEKFNEWVMKIREGHEGVQNAYKTLFLGAGADATAIGSSLEQMTFKEVQGAGEVRIATVARVPPVLLGISEGLQGSTLNSGNYQASRRMFADGCIRPLWRQACGALASIVPAPGNARLWYDDRDIAFLKEDAKDTAQVQQMQAAAMSSLFMAGWDPDSIVDAITADDLTRLTHVGLPSVQLQPTGNGSQNGSGGTLTGKPPVVASQ